MPLTVDRKVHEMRAECDGAKTDTIIIQLEKGWINNNGEIQK